MQLLALAEDKDESLLKSNLNKIRTFKKRCNLILVTPLFSLKYRVYHSVNYSCFIIEISLSIVPSFSRIAFGFSATGTKPIFSYNPRARSFPSM